MHRLTKDCLVYSRIRGRQRTIIRKAAAFSLEVVFSFCSYGNLCFMHRRSSHRQFPRYCLIWREVFQHRKNWRSWIFEQNVFIQKWELPLEGGSTNNLDISLLASIKSLERLFSQMNVIKSDVRNRLIEQSSKGSP